MPTAQISVKFVNQPAQGRKDGSVKLANGEYWNVPLGLLGQFAPNTNYSVEFTEKAGTGQYAGRTFRTINRIISAEAPKAASSGGSKYGQTDDATAERIFICGAVNAAIQAGQINVTDGPGTLEIVRKLREVWKRSFGAKPAETQAAPPPPPEKTAAQRREDMDDEIPW